MGMDIIVMHACTMCGSACLYYLGEAYFSAPSSVPNITTTTNAHTSHRSRPGHDCDGNPFGDCTELALGNATRERVKVNGRFGKIWCGTESDDAAFTGARCTEQSCRDVIGRGLRRVRESSE